MEVEDWVRLLGGGGKSSAVGDVAAFRTGFMGCCGSGMRSADVGVRAVVGESVFEEVRATLGAILEGDVGSAFDCGIFVLVSMRCKGEGMACEDAPRL